VGVRFAHVALTFVFHPVVDSSLRTDAAKSYAEGRGLTNSKPNGTARFIVVARDVHGVLFFSPSVRLAFAS
jgi:hypothetical protein